ncbi:glycosyltransferase family 4 protein [Chloroflexota bacterium]
MKVCFVVSQLFAWGKYGGFGSLTRTLGREMVERGVQVSAVVPGRSGQRSVEYLDGIEVLSFPQWSLGLFERRLYRECDADIYHSEEPTLGTWAARKAMPDRRHLVTFQDPRDREGWLIEFLHAESARRKLYYPVLRFYERNRLVDRAVRSADSTYCQARTLCTKAQKIFNLSTTPGFLPNPVIVPAEPVDKASKPTVCFLGRFDPVKKPEVFFELAREFPKVRFVAIGTAENPRRDRELREKYAGIPNLQLTGFIDQFVSGGVYDLLGQSWIVINTSAKEALPVSFLEAAACRCAIISPHDADGFATKFGRHVQNADFAGALESLLSNDEWRSRGQAAYEYVKQTHEVGAVVDRHLVEYQAVLAGARTRS